ncbi:CCA tRNA nucleotidyltransferase, mitochondrial [Cryptotrichosporon argae]
MSSAAQITLSATEQRFVDLLDEFAASRDPPVECRIAGGWVRDKLLSLPSHDLDIALSIPSGHSFAVDFVSYLQTKDIPTGGVGKVAANPEQSKHLETGVTTILGLECDFVGLRSESYTDSRIPDQVQLGTPLEDALRRDLTINSLFFNVRTRAVEDHTAHGLSDLAHRVARTPLPPRQTFFDDPLRVLRCVRFAARFGLSIVDDVAEAIRDEDVKAALRTKVSKERVGIELTKMTQHDPLRAFALIDALGLHPSMLPSPVAPDPPRAAALTAAHVLTDVIRRFPGKGTDALWLAAATVPFRDLVVRGKREVPAVSVVISEGLKLSNTTRDAVLSLHDAPHHLSPALTDRGELGLACQHPAVRPWETAILWCATAAILPTWTGRWDAEADAALERYRALARRIVDLGLPADLDKPHLLGGRELQALLGAKGPVLNAIKAAVMRWQLEHPGAGAAECEAYVRAAWAGEARQEWEEAAKRGEKRKR